MKKLDREQKILAYTVVTIILSTAGYMAYRNWLYSSGRENLSAIDAAADEMNNLPPGISYNPEVKKIAKDLISQTEKNRKVSKKAMGFLKSAMNDSNVSNFFNYTLEFFGKNNGAYPAARFVALTMIFNSGPENLELMMWTKKEIREHSGEIMRLLEQKKDDINVNPYFHNRMLNLANSLDVPSQRKINFYADTIAQPLSVAEKGNLNDGSLSFEVALVLAKQSTDSSSEVAPIVARALSVNHDPTQVKAIRERVLTYYPDLTYLFH